MPKEFLKQIVTLNICDMRNMPFVSVTWLYARINGQLLFRKGTTVTHNSGKKRRFRPLKTCQFYFNVPLPNQNRLKCYDLQEHKAKQ